MTTPFKPDTNGGPACDLNGHQPGDVVPVPMTPPIEWFAEPPEWMVPGYGASVALCGEETGRFALYVAEFDKAFHDPYVLPSGRVLTHHPRGATLFDSAWNNPVTVLDENGEPVIIAAGLFGFEHSPDPSDEVDSYASLAAETLEFHTTVRSQGSVKENPLAALAYVTWGENQKGPYMVGSLKPGVTYADAMSLFSAQVSTELLFDGRDFYALPAAAIPIGNAQRSRIAAATSSNGPREYSVRILAAATVAPVIEEVDPGTVVVEEEIIMADPVDLSAIEDQLGAMASAMGQSLEALNGRIDAITPEPEPVPEQWEEPVAKLTEVSAGLEERMVAISERIDEFTAALATVSNDMEHMADAIAGIITGDEEMSPEDVTAATQAAVDAAAAEGAAEAEAAATTAAETEAAAATAEAAAATAETEGAEGAASSSD